MRTTQQERALRAPCYFGFECAQPKYRRQHEDYSVILTVNAGYE